MLTLSATCVAIDRADQRGTLQLIERGSRLGGTYIAICDEVGVIEVANDGDEAHARVAQVRARRMERFS